MKREKRSRYGVRHNKNLLYNIYFEFIIKKLMLHCLVGFYIFLYAVSVVKNNFTNFIGFDVFPSNLLHKINEYNIYIYFISYGHNIVYSKFKYFLNQIY